MNVSLTKEREDLVNSKVQTGRYLSASGVVREALRLLEERDRMKEIRVEEMRRAIRAGEEQLTRGEGIPSEAVFGEIRERSRQRRKEA